MKIFDTATVFHNKNGSDCYLFPDFIVAYENIVKSFGIINHMDLRIKSYKQKRKKFLIIVDYTWKYDIKTAVTHKMIIIKFQLFYIMN